VTPRLGTCVIVKTDYYVKQIGGMGRRGVIVGVREEDGVRRADHDRRVTVYLFPNIKGGRYSGAFTFNAAELTPTSCRRVEARVIDTNVVQSKHANQESRELFSVVHDEMLEKLPRGRRGKR
jgi:hypothetical protein